MAFKSAWIGKQDAGDANMQELAGHIADGAMAFLKAEWKVLSIFVLITASILAEIRNTCRRAGIQVGTIDALLARLCLRHDLTLLTTDNDFKHAARLYPLRIWSARG